MTLRSSDLQSDSDLDSIRNSCDVFDKLVVDVNEIFFLFGNNFNLISFLCIGFVSFPS